MDRPVFFFAFANDRVDERRFLRQLALEKRQLRALLAPKQAQIELVVRDNATLDEIFEVFQSPAWRDRIAVFHFAGHASSGALYFEPTAGADAAAHGEGLAAFLAQQQGLKFVCLNGCSSRAHADRLTALGVPAVVATAQSIDDTVATRFATRLYRSIASGVALQRAFDEAAAAERAAHGSPDAAHRSFLPSEAQATAAWPWDLHVARPDAAQHVLMPAQRSAQRSAQRPCLMPILPYACNRNDQVGRLKAELVQHLRVRASRPMVFILHGDERDAPSEFVRRLGLLTLPRVLGLPENARIEAPPRVMLRDGGGPKQMRIDGLFAQVAESLCGRATADLDAMVETVTQQRAPVLLELVWEMSPRARLTVDLLDGLLQRLANWPDCGPGRTLIVALVLSYRDVPPSGLWAWLRSLFQPGVGKVADALTQELGQRANSGLPRVVLPALSLITVADVMTWIQEYAVQSATEDPAQRMLLEERLRPRLEALFDPRDVQMRMRDLVPQIRQNFEECLQQEGLG